MFEALLKGVCIYYLTLEELKGVTQRPTEFRRVAHSFGVLAVLFWQFLNGILLRDSPYE